MTEAETAKWTARLEAALDAYHEAAIGGTVRVTVDSSGERAEFFAGSRTSLRAYIMELQIKLGLPLDVSPPMGVRIC